MLYSLQRKGKAVFVRHDHSRSYSWSLGIHFCVATFRRKKYQVPTNHPKILYYILYSSQKRNRNSKLAWHHMIIQNKLWAKINHNSSHTFTHDHDLIENDKESHWDQHSSERRLFFSLAKNEQQHAAVGVCTSDHFHTVLKEMCILSIKYIRTYSPTVHYLKLCVYICRSLCKYFEIHQAVSVYVSTL